jgi:hypothetical protein
MDSIDITDSAFSLDIPDTNSIIQLNSDSNIVGGTGFSWEFINQPYFYIGVVVVIALIGMFAYKYYQNRKHKQSVTFEDCPGGFCTMDQKPNRSI